MKYEASSSCFSCGAPLKNTGVCEYCRTVHVTSKEPLNPSIHRQADDFKGFYDEADQHMRLIKKVIKESFV